MEGKRAPLTISSIGHLYKREWGWSADDNRGTCGSFSAKNIEIKSSSGSNDYSKIWNRIVVVFYDDSGKLWKYSAIDDIWGSEHKYDKIRWSTMEYNWCLSNDENNMMSNVDLGETYGVAIRSETGKE